MSNSGSSIKNDAIREIAAGSITGVYQPFGGPYLRDSFREWFTNNSNGDIYFSTDGVTDMLKFPAQSGRAYDNKTDDMFRKTGTQWHIRFDSVPAVAAGWAGLEVEWV